MKPLQPLIEFALRHLPDAPVNERIALLRIAAEYHTDEAVKEQCEVTAAALKHAEDCQQLLAGVLKPHP